MPKPKAGESRQEFVSRCIPIVLDEGTAKESKQAAAICYSMFTEHKADMSDDGLDLVDRPARLFRAGHYPDKGYRASMDDLDELIANTTAMQAKVPLDLKHADTDDTLETGQLVPGSLRRDGAWVYGTMRLPRAIDQLLKARGLSVSIDRAGRYFRKITVTPRPRVPGAGFSAEQQTAEGDLIVFDGGELMPEDTNTVTPPAGQEGFPGADEQVPNWFQRFAARFQQETASVTGGGTAETPQAPVLPSPTADPAFEELKRENARNKEQIARMQADMAKERITARTREEIAQGVLPAHAKRLVPLLFALPDGAEVSFSEGDQEVSLSVPKAVEQVLTSLRGTVKSGLALGEFGDDRPDEDFDAKWARHASRIRTDNPLMSELQIAELADRASFEEVS